MIGYFVQWIMANVVRGPFASIHATVRGRLKDVPDAMFSVECSVCV
jgi:hypothetical protein